MARWLTLANPLRHGDQHEQQRHDRNAEFEFMLAERDRSGRERDERGQVSGPEERRQQAAERGTGYRHECGKFMPRKVGNEDQRWDQLDRRKGDRPERCHREPEPWCRL